MVISNNLNKTKSKIELSLYPKKGYTAITVDKFYRKEDGTTVISKFKTLGEVSERAKSKEEVAKQDEVIEKAKQAIPKMKELENFANSGIEESIAVLEDIKNNKSFSEEGKNEIVKKAEDAIYRLAEYSLSVSKTEAAAVNDLADELLKEIENIKVDITPVNQDEVRNNTSDVFAKDQPKTLRSLEGQEFEFNGEKGIVGIDDGVVVLLNDNNDTIEISNNPDQLISGS